MFKLFGFVLAVLPVLGADNPWDKVVALKTGTEIRIYKREAKQPILATMDEANAERVVVVVKNEQVAIAKDDIDRLDYRPARTGKRFEKQTSSSVSENRDKVAAPQGHPGMTSGTSTNFGIQPKPDFETIYRRPPPAPRDQQK